MITTKTRTILISLALTIGTVFFVSSMSPSKPVIADEPAAAAAAVNIFHGTYEGGFWGNANSIPYGGDIKSTVSQPGAAAITLPGATGIVPVTGNSSPTLEASP